MRLRIETEGAFRLDDWLRFVPAFQVWHGGGE